MRHFNSWKLRSNQITVEKITASCNFLSFFDPFTSMCCLCFDYFLKRREKKHRAVFSLRLLFADTFFQMTLLHLQTFPFLSSFLKKHRKAGKSFPGTTDHGNAQVGAIQPKAGRPHVHGGTSPLKGKFMMYLRGKTANPSLLTDLNRQKLRHSSLGSMAPPHPPTLPWGLCDMSCWGTQIGCPELCLQDFWGSGDELRGFLPF